jgi:hypothetical protein
LKELLSAKIIEDDLNKIKELKKFELNEIDGEKEIVRYTFLIFRSMKQRKTLIKHHIQQQIKIYFQI